MLYGRGWFLWRKEGVSCQCQCFFMCRGFVCGLVGCWFSSVRFWILFGGLTHWRVCDESMRTTNECYKTERKQGNNWQPVASRKQTQRAYAACYAPCHQRVRNLRFWRKSRAPFSSQKPNPECIECSHSLRSAFDGARAHIFGNDSVFECRRLARSSCH